MKKSKIKVLFDLGFTILMLTLSTLLGVLFRRWNFHETNVVIVYIFSVLIISRITKGYVFGLVSSVVSFLLFNWFFTEPYFTFKVNDMTYLITFFIMTSTSIVTSTLTTKVKKAATDAKEKESESNALYQMTNHLTDAENADDIAKIIVKTTSNILNCNTGFICFNENGEPEKTFLQSKDDGSIIRRELSKAEELKKRVETLHGAVDITQNEHQYPVYGKSVILAVLTIPNKTGENLTESQTRIIHSIIESASLALEKLRSLQAQVKSSEETAQERYRSNLLRAISHDIRTPLSGIMGTSEVLMGKTDKDDPRYALAEDIYKDAEWLHGLVENILNLTKLQDGKLILDKQPEALEEVIGASLMVMEKRLPGRNIEVEMPETFIMVPMDAKLISQVLINLLDNASKHTKKENEIKISVGVSDQNVIVSVLDRGSGISKEDLPHVFQTFYTSNRKNPDSKRGVGLGLAICQSIIEAHGGTISAKNRDGGGACFTFTLPLEAQKNDD